MSEADLGYGNMFPLGRSYAFGQAVLHQEIAPNPNDPGLPNDGDLLAFADACDGADTDRSDWSSAQFDAALKAARARSDLRTLWSIYAANGPLPVDGQTDQGSTTADLWGADDNIQKERYVYIYATENPNFFGLDETSALYVQIQGYSTSTNTWVLPRIGGAQVTRWRYDGPIGGPVRTGSRQYKGKIGISEYMHAHGEAIKTWTLVAISVILTVFTAGVGAAVIAPLAVGISAATGIAAAAATVIAGNIVAALGGLAFAGIKAAMTGDSSQLVGALVKLGGAVAPVAGAEFSNLTSHVDLGEFGSAVKDIATTFTKLKDSLQGDEAQIETWLKAAAAQAKLVPFVDWTKAEKIVGAEVGSVSGFFIGQARHAVNADELTALYNNAPWYAQGIVQYGATLRALEIVQTSPDPRALAQGRDTGLVSVLYMLSAKGQLEAKNKAPALTRITPVSTKNANAPAVGTTGASVGALGAVAALRVASSSSAFVAKNFWMLAAAVGLGAYTLQKSAPQMRLMAPDAPTVAVSTMRAAQAPLLRAVK